MEAITVPGTLESLKKISQYVMTAAEQAGIDRQSAYKLRLSIDEIATNIILHGYEEAGRSGVIDLKATITQQALTIILEDTGTPYNPFHQMGPDETDLQKPLDERSIGGLGVFLALDGVDKFTYDYVNGRNRNSLMLNCSVDSLIS